MASRKKLVVLPIERITQSIIILRGKRVLLDSDLAVHYGVATNRLTQQVQRNLGRFPDDCMLQIETCLNGGLSGS